MFNNFDDILSIEDVSSALKIGTTQTYKLVRSGQLKAYKEGKDWKIPKTALQEYVTRKVFVNQGEKDNDTDTGNL